MAWLVNILLQVSKQGQNIKIQVGYIRKYPKTRMILTIFESGSLTLGPGKLEKFMEKIMEFEELKRVWTLSRPRFLSILAQLESGSLSLSRMIQTKIWLCHGQLNLIVLEGLKVQFFPPFNVLCLITWNVLLAIKLYLDLIIQRFPNWKHHGRLFLVE